MGREQSFIGDLISHYAKDGWQPIHPEESGSELGFVPDVFLGRGNDRLVIDVKEAGYTESRALSTIRRLVESHQGWRFEVKVIPPGWGKDSAVQVPEHVRRRIELSERLFEDGDAKEAFILSWTALEALLRQRLSDAAEPGVRSPQKLVRAAFENGCVTPDQLRILEIGLRVRDRLMHGIHEDLTEAKVVELLEVVRAIAHAQRPDGEIGLAGAP